MSEMPKLSEELTGPRCLGYCQACGRSRSMGAALTVWQEKDEQDRPQAVYLQLCESCADMLIEPHARLYERMQANAPMPGAMEICRGCRYAEAMRCSHPDLKANGGPGLMLAVPKPFVAMVDGTGFHGPMKLYTGRVECRGRRDPQLDPSLEVKAP